VNFQAFKFCNKCGQSLAPAQTTQPSTVSVIPSSVPTSLTNGRHQVKKYLGEVGKKKVYLVHISKKEGNVVRINFGLPYIFALALVLVSVAVLPGCGGQATTSTSTKTSTSTAQTTTIKPTKAVSPSILIMSPESGFVSNTGDVTITVKVLSFTLVEKVGQTNVVGEGHIVYYLDVDVPKTQGAQATTAQDTYAVTSATSHTWHSLKAGHHMLRVQLVNNNNTPLSDPIFASVGIDVD
jgi:hypothetical protein